MNLDEKKLVKYTKIMAVIFAMIISIFVLSSKVPEMKIMKDTIAAIENNEETVAKFGGATIATSVAISALPNDFATPLAESLAGMNKYFVFILIILFVEKLVITVGVPLTFQYVFPIAGGLYLISRLFKKDMVGQFAVKVLALGLAIVLVIPCSTYFIENVGEKYLNYVDETIEETNLGADKINGVLEQTDADESFFDKLEGVFSVAMESVTDLLDYFKNLVNKCINSIAILIVSTFLTPIVTFVFFRWLLKELFSITFPQVNTKQIDDNTKQLVKKGGSIVKGD